MSRFTESESVLLGLLRQALFGIPFTIPDGVDWDDVFQEAKAQSVAGLIAGHVSDNAGSQWKHAYSGNLANSIRYLHAQGELINLFDTRRLPLVILKGSAAAVCYPVPLHREMGDIDFIVPQDRYADACALMIDSGYSLHQASPAYTRHRGFRKDKTEFELHHHFSYDDLDIEQYIIEGLKNPAQGSIDGIRFPMLPEPANGLVLLAHMRRHLQSGLGLRQVIDWMMYVDKVLDDEFWQREFKTAAESAGMERLAITATRMCQIHLGLRDDITWCSGADENLCDRLMESLLSYGNFGRKHGKGNQVENVATAIRKRGLFRYLQTAGESMWKLYQEHRWLKPFCWIYQIGRLAVKGVQSGRGKKALRDLENSRDRYELLKQLNVVQ